MSDDRVKGQAERRCPRCFYNLHGLPEPCDCPECGEHIDAGARMWRAMAPRSGDLRRMARLIFAPLFLLLWFWQVLEWFIEPSIPLDITRFAVLIGAICWVWYVDHQQLFVYISRRGICLRIQTLRPLDLPWNHVRAMRRRQYDCEVDLVYRLPSCGVIRDKIRRPWASREVTMRMFRTPADTAAFLELAEQMRCDQYQSPAVEGRGFG